MDGGKIVTVGVVADGHSSECFEFGAGVIDPDYRDEVKVLLFNHDKSEPFVIQPGDRIAQVIFEEVAYPRMVQKDARNLRDIRNLREKYHQGFGSTGKGVALEQQGWDSDPDLTQSSHTIAMLEEQELETEYPQIQKIEQIIAKHSKRQDTMEAIEFAAAYEMMTEDFGNTELQDESSSSQDRQKQKKKQKKKKRALCKHCYPEEEYKEFEAVQVIKLSFLTLL